MKEDPFFDLTVCAGMLMKTPDNLPVVIAPRMYAYLCDHVGKDVVDYAIEKGCTVVAEPIPIEDEQR